MTKAKILCQAVHSCSIYKKFRCDRIQIGGAGIPELGIDHRYHLFIGLHCVGKQDFIFMGYNFIAFGIGYGMSYDTAFFTRKMFKYYLCIHKYFPGFS